MLDDQAARNERRRLHYAANKVKIRDQQRQLYLINREAVLAQQKTYQANHPGQASRRVAEWRKANPEKFKALRKRTKGERRRTRPWIDACRSLISCAVRSHGFTKRSRTTEILGCDWATFKAWIEQQFTEGMAWGNYGAWHIDHCVPIATAKCEHEHLQLNHYTNLQPMWAKDNLSKRATLDHLSCALQRA